MLKHVCIKYKADFFATMVISIPWKNGIFSMFVYCGIACTYCTIRKYTSKDVELYLEECLLQNYVFPFSRLFPLHPQVFVLQNSVSNMLCGKCGFFWFGIFPSVWFFFFFLANLRSFSLWTMPNNSDHMGKVGCSCIWNSPVSEVLLCQCRQK